MDNRHSDNCDLVMNIRLGLRRPVCTCGVARAYTPPQRMLRDHPEEPHYDYADMPDYFGGGGGSRCQDDFGDQ